MSVQKFSRKMEARALLTLCHDGSTMGIECANMLVSQLSQDHFATPLGQKVYRRARQLLKTHSELPDLEEILEDPGLEKTYRNELAEIVELGEAKPVKLADNLHKLIKSLDRFRKIRALLSLGVYLEEAFDQDRMDPDDIISGLATQITNAGSATRQMKVYSRGDGNTILALVREMMKGNGPSFIPTGIRAFDKENSGIPRATFAALAATTGGGKSTMISHMAEYMASCGARVGIVPLEMDAGEMSLRDVARNSRIELSNLINPREKLSPELRKKAYLAYKKKTLEIDKRGGCVKIIEPGGDVDIHGLLAEVRAFDFDVIFIDYIGLLKGAESEGQWRELGNIARYSKVWSGMTKTTVIMAAQLSAEGLIRYSGAIAEHAAYAWGWVKDDWAKETNIYTIDQLKVRQGRQFKFPVYIDSDIMEVRDLTDDERAEWQEHMDQQAKQNGNGAGRRPSKGGKKKPATKKRDEEDDDDDAPPKKSRSSHGGSKWSPDYKGGKPKKRFVEEEF